ncbi:MAG: MFS transporter [Alphaproteobacteria bacterium]
MSAPRRAIAGWCLYDWANSPFPTVVLTFIVPAYFAKAVMESEAAATAAWGFMSGASALALALLAPVMGAIADQGRGRKPFLAVATLAMAAASAALWFAGPRAGDAVLLLWLVAIATVAFELGMVFYNALLPGLVPAARLGRVSGLGWGLGYFGGLAGLVLILFGFVQAAEPPLGLDRTTAEHVRIAGPIVAAWALVFALPLFAWTPEPRLGPGLPAIAAVRTGLATLGRGLVALWRDPARRPMARFLVARMLYIDGVNTLFAFGGIYAATVYAMSVEEVALFGIALNVTAGIGAIAFGWLDDRVGSRTTILAGICGIVACGVPILVLGDVLWFWVFGAALGIFFGPVQAASRSLMARLTPPGEEGESFGLFGLSGRALAFLGPWLVGVVTIATGSPRWGLATVVPFLVAGGLLLLIVREPNDDD